MNVEMSRCEVCKKTVEDRYVQKGWVNIEGDFTVSIYLRRDHTGQAKARYSRRIGQSDYCSVRCFLKWLEELRGTG